MFLDTYSWVLRSPFDIGNLRTNYGFESSELFKTSEMFSICLTVMEENTAVSPLTSVTLIIIHHLFIIILISLQLITSAQVIGHSVYNDKIVEVSTQVPALDNVIIYGNFVRGK